MRLPGNQYKKFQEALRKLEGWYDTWHVNYSHNVKGVGGLVATLWNSSWYACMPHVLNVSPVIRGLCWRAHDSNGGFALERAIPLVRFLISVQDPQSGHFIPAWGDIPYKSTGMIHQTMATAALWEYYGVSRDEEALSAAQRSTDAIHNCCDSNVINQLLRHMETLILRLNVLGRPDDKKEVDYIKRIGSDVLSVQFADKQIKGSFPQSYSCDGIYGCYQAKCLSSLISIGNFLSDERYIESAIRLAEFIESRMLFETEQGSLITYGFDPTGPNFKKWQVLYKVRRIVPFAEESVRKRRVSSINDWQLYHKPVWIARSADAAHGFLLLYELTNDDRWYAVAIKIINAILYFQTPMGGIRNTIGFFGDGKINDAVWQDAAPITRWNAYVIQLLHFLLRGSRVEAPAKLSNGLKDEIKLKDGNTYKETALEVSMENKKGGILWKIKKGYRWASPRIQYEKWDEGSKMSDRTVNFI